MPNWIAWAGFFVFVLLMLALDLGVLNRGAHIIRTRTALLFSLVCAILAACFAGFVYGAYENDWFLLKTNSPEQLSGKDAALQFMTGWIIEQSLSLDNIFVIAVIFSFFGVPMKHQHRTLFWGIMGALIMRLAMIMLGAKLLEQFDWIMYFFGGLLLYTAYKMLRSGDEQVHPDRNPLVRVARKFYPVTSEFHEQRFFVQVDGRTAITPLFLTLLAIESTDVIFAVDSIPAIFAVTKDPFIVFTSNVFAILNLRSLYFALADLLDRFRLLKYSLVLVLAFVGVKMLVEQAFGWHVPIAATLGIVVVALTAGVVVSMLMTKKEKKQEDLEEAAGIDNASASEK